MKMLVGGAIYLLCVGCGGVPNGLSIMDRPGQEAGAASGVEAAASDTGADAGPSAMPVVDTAAMDGTANQALAVSDGSLAKDIEVTVSVGATTSDAEATSDAKAISDAKATSDAAAGDSRAGGDAVADATGPVDQPPTVCALASVRAATFTVVNNYSNITVTPYWIDGSCREQPYPQVGPGSTWSIGSFVTHPWRIRNSADHTLLVDVPPLVGNTTVAVP